MSVSEEDQDPPVNLEPIRSAIYKLKKNLFLNIVSNDTKHDPSNMEAMMSFHALFLQCIAYWIGTLDNNPVPKPSIQGPTFDYITNEIHGVINDRTQIPIIYQLLLNFSMEQPFILDTSVNRNVGDE